MRCVTREGEGNLDTVSSNQYPRLQFGTDSTSEMISFTGLRAKISIEANGVTDMRVIESV